MRFPHLDGRARKLADALDLPADLAEWLAVSALHSGCFLRSQLLFYRGIDIENITGADRKTITRLIHLLASRQLITEISIKSLGLLARVRSKSVYRFIGADNIRHRRETELPITFRRLLSLDYVLEHPQLPWLPTEEEKVSCFDRLGIERSQLPRRVWGNAAGHTVRLFANKHPIAVDPRGKQAWFVYADSQEDSPQGVCSWRTEHKALWSELHLLGFKLHIVHASFNTRLQKSVNRVFTNWKHQPRSRFSRAEIERELERVQQALHSEDRSALKVYGGLGGAMRASAALKKRLEQHDKFASFTASYSTWISERILQATSNPNPCGSHTPKA